MIPTQEVVITTEKGRVIRIDFDRHANRFKPVGTVFLKEQGLTSLNLAEYEGNNANDVFDRILGRLKESLDGHADMITAIDNPCNDEFVKVAHQLVCAAKEHMPFAVKLNGQRLA